MRLEFFHLNKHPFSLFPDPRVVYFSQAHARVKSSLSYNAWKGDGIAVITGDNGTGKTLMLRYHQQRMRGRFDCFYLPHCRLTSLEFLRYLLACMGKAAFSAEPSRLLALIHRELLNRFAKGRRCVLLLDDAHELQDESLLMLRNLSEIGVAGQPLLTLVLCGSPALQQRLREPAMVAIAEQVRFSCELLSLARLNTSEYLSFRLLDAGAREQLFSDPARSLIHQFSRGIPRKINLLAEMALVAAYVNSERQVTATHVATAMDELGWAPRKTASSTMTVVPLSGSQSDGVISGAQLTLYRNGALLDSIAIEGDEITVGRSPDSDVRLYDPEAGQIHAVLRREAGQVVLEDCGQRGGTRVNGELISRRSLQFGDEIQIASYIMGFDLNRSQRSQSETLSRPQPAQRADVITRVRWLG